MQIRTSPREVKIITLPLWDCLDPKEPKRARKNQLCPPKIGYTGSIFLTTRAHTMMPVGCRSYPNTYANDASECIYL